jgi:threonine dehydrogenase-like Zn-dependent dehydrogenase
MDIRMRIATMAIAGAGALGLVVMGAGAALAGTGTVTAVTHASDHPDTTNASGPACGTSDNGPTWAADNLSRQFSVTDNGNGTFTVVITDHGSFAGFADPNTCRPLTSNGPVEGTYTLTVTSPTGPDPAGLAPQYRGDVSTSSMVQDLFDGHATSIVGGFYSYSYQNGNYVQDSNGITGSIRGH